MQYSIGTDNNILACTAEEAAAAAAAGNVIFEDASQLDAATTDWPAARLVEVWNSFAGVVPFDDLKPVKKFENRGRAITRIAQAAARLTPPPAPKPAPKGEDVRDILAGAKTAKKKAPKAPKPASKPKPAPRAKESAPAEGSKKDQAIAMMRRKGGATIDELMSTMGWQRHTVRGFVAGALKKMGLEVESTKNEAGERTYAIK